MIATMGYASYHIATGGTCTWPDYFQSDHPTATDYVRSDDTAGQIIAARNSYYQQTVEEERELIKKQIKLSNASSSKARINFLMRTVKIKYIKPNLQTINYNHIFSARLLGNPKPQRRVAELKEK